MMHDTQEMLWTGTHYRTAPLARAEYETTATSVTVSHWNNVYDAQPNAANIAVFADGELIESFHAPSAGAHQNVVALPAGEKLVEIVIGGMRGPGGSNGDLPTFVGQGIFLSGIEFDAPAQPTPHKKGGLLILTDSIGNGSTLANPAVEAYPSLLRRMVDYPVRVLGRGGMALYDVTARVGSQPAFFLPKLEREILRFQPDMVLFTLGYNDANKGAETSSAFADRFKNFTLSMRNLSPSTYVTVTGLTPAVTPPPNMSFYNNSLFTSPTNGEYWFGVDWRTGIIDTSLLNDNVHPNAQAHAQMAAFLYGMLPQLDVPPGLDLFPTPSIIEPVDPSNRRLSFSISGAFNMYDFGGQHRRWYNPNVGGRIVSHSSAWQEMLTDYEVRNNGGSWMPISRTTPNYIHNPPNYNLLEIRKRGQNKILKTMEAVYQT